jgi:hypothetical protein
MQKLYIEPTGLTPEINFSPDENIFIIRGVSSPEDVRALYYPVIEWIKIFTDDIIDGDLKGFHKDSPVRMHIDLSYFNSSSAKFLFDIFTELKRLKSSEVPVVVEWLHEDEDLDMREAGSDIAELVEMEFTFVIKPKTHE